MSFGEYSLPTDTLAAILGAYPFSVGVFRELLQNSDDAGATKQVFVLDARSHGTGKLLHPKLESTQGPSLLAYNDAVFSDADWDALQSIHRSSKKQDTNKIGKYGIGFRSCYHITDNPQVLSGSSLGILDPHHHFTESGGIKIDFATKAAEHSDQLAAFEFFLPADAHQRDFSGSVIRLPLRKPGARSSISSKAVDATEIRQLFADFIREEIGISLLFLQNILSIEVHAVDAQGGRECLAKSTIQKDKTVSWTDGSDRHTSFKCTAMVETPSLGQVEKTWRIIHSYFPDKYSTSLLSLRLGQDPRPVLSKHKLLSEMAIAMPMSILTKEEDSGRLFTYLPLPLRTGFPCHIHALFALTQSRQNLVNAGAVGIVRGSDDSVLVEWNKILFDSFLPRCWAALLRLLLQSDDLRDVFRAWPPRQSEVFGGDSVYWQSICAKLLACIVESKAELWPVVAGSKGGTLPQFSDLSSVLVTSSEVDEATLRALANAELRVSQLPTYIFELVSQATGLQCTLLSPSVAYLKLTSQVAHIQTMDAADRIALLQYLLRTKRLDYVVGLPLIPLVNGNFLAPGRSGVGPAHTMLTQAECDVFKDVDPTAISLPLIPVQLRDLFKVSPLLDISPLSPEKVASYLQSAPHGFDLSERHEGKLNEEIFAFIVAFWAWVGTWAMRDQLLPHLQTLCIIPAGTGRSASLESLEVGVFSELDVDPILVSICRRLGLAFLHPGFSADARKGLAFYPLVLKRLGDIHLILDRIRIDTALQLERDEAHVLSKHVLDCVLQTCQQRPLDQTQQDKLRSLPIFALLSPSTAAPVAEKSPRVLSGFRFTSLHRKSKSVSMPDLSPIPNGGTVLGIPPGTTVPLPVAEGVVYLDGTHIDLAILAQLGASTNKAPLSTIDILTLALEHFSSQSKSLQSAFLDHMVRNRDAVPPAVLNTLRQAVFVPVLDGTLRSPAHVIDPTKSDLLLVLRHLRSLGLLAASVTAEIVTERIEFISSRSTLPESKTLSIQILAMLYTSAPDWMAISIPPDAKWLPTAGGLVSRGQCFEAAQQPELFDEVVPVLDRDVKVSPSLRIVLGWDQPIPMQILLGQLRAVLQSGRASTLKLDCLIREFSVRALSDTDIIEVSNITSGKAWIPVASNRLASTNFAVFQSTSGLAEFHQIPFSLADQSDVRKFLVRMGCTDRPSTAVLIDQLKTLEKACHTRDVVDQALLILKVLAEDLRSINRKAILVPDNGGILRPVSDVMFNDVGERACLIDHGDHYLGHPKLSDELSKQLLMDRLGFKSVETVPQPIDMGETLTTTIRNVLKQYSEQQICNEFLANACDADATKFGILVDERPGNTEKLLSQTMKAFQTCSSLVLYNNGVFSPKDFEGICKTGIGGKEGRTNTIGQFGLGVLSMFHFTELAMIVSGSQVLFLNPSKTHLPIQGRASLLLPLDQVKRWYPDHLQCLDGLFDFHTARSDYYNGTLFRLPLRNTSHINADSILTSTRITPQHIRDKILKPYYLSAKHAFFFTKMENIFTLNRDSVGNQTRGWGITTSRDPPQSVFNFRTQLVHVHSGSSTTEDFKVVSVSFPLRDLPSEFTPLVEPHRLRSPIVVGLAAPLIQTNANHHLFSVLQLPITTTLPVHLTASFILTPDRRHVRLDDYATPESKYNRWLLSEVVPPLYLFLLEDLLKTQASLGNEGWWPGNGQQQDNVSKYVVDAFYSTHLASTKRRVCSSISEMGEFRPSDMLLGGNEPAPVSKILALLGTRRIVRLPPNVRERCAAVMKPVDQGLVHSEIKKNESRLRSSFSKGEVTSRDIQHLSAFLLQDTGIDFAGLPLLPLADGKLALLQKSKAGTAPYCVWKPAYPDRILFRSEFLVNPEFDAKDFLDKDLNVSRLSFSSLQELIKQHFPEADDKSGMKEVEEEWVKTFWAEYPHFGIGAGIQFSTFPLVRTMRPGHYVSLSHCYTSKAIVVSNSEPFWLCAVLDLLGASVVQRDRKDLQKPLRDALKIYPSFSFERVLQYLQSIQPSLSKRFTQLLPDVHTEFADWARGQILSTPERLIPTASALPIWKKLQQEQAITLHTASELKMLPFGIGRDIAMRFIGVASVEHNTSLVHLKVVPMDFSQFWNHLKLPTTLKVEDQQVYKQLLSLMPPTLIYDTVLVPDGNRRLVKVNTLYTRHALFVAAFGSDLSATHFILDIFRDLEPRLVSLGLKSHTNLDVETFKACALSIQADSEHPDITARARVVFKAYAEDVPLRIDSTQEHIWRELDKLRFIPRHPLRRRTMGIEESSVYVKHLHADIVSPEQVLLLENEAVAWTQRAVLLHPPEERLLVANRSFGQPTPKEVVEHLRVLTLRVAKDYTSDIYLLSDLEATYGWLDDHQDEVADIMIDFHDEPLFLNVDDPKSDPWLFHSADELFFNIRDGGDLKSVKKFLVPFHDLLHVSGVEDIVKAPVPDLVRSSVDAQLARLRTGFQMMRKEGKLCDVVFIADDEARYVAHRAYLAPMSEYLNDLFCGTFTEAGPGTADEPIEIEVDYPGPCVEAALDYLYAGKTPSLERLEDLLDVMDLSNYWNMGELNQLVQVKIIGNNQISPATYEEVVARATVLDAKLLLEACQFFERENREAILRLKGQHKGKPRSARRLPKKASHTPRIPSFAAASASSNQSGSPPSSRIKVKSPTAKKVAKGIMKGLRRVGDTWDFMSEKEK
ncbi:BTB domain-containing protein [Favolaschia claudopus]|uniref:BTB domain-containing protein n=1 Tax=Favolaschia claudopus TaxID=2862362 RepID=A0AAW0AYI6_9AGAR